MLAPPLLNPQFDLGRLEEYTPYVLASALELVAAEDDNFMKELKGALDLLFYRDLKLTVFFLLLN